MKQIMKGDTPTAKAYNEGYHAAINDKTVKDCLYNSITEERLVHWWLEGYTHGCKAILTIKTNYPNVKSNKD